MATIEYRRVNSPTERIGLFVQM